MSATDTQARPPQSEPTLRAIAMPADANPHGDIFGGFGSSQDLAGGTVARAARQRPHRRSGDHRRMTFHRPVFIGDEVTATAPSSRSGRTSITVKGRGWVQRGIGRRITR